MAAGNPIKRLFDLYTSELSFDEIERMIKMESAAVYEFYKNEIPEPIAYQNKFNRSITFIKSLFNAFLMKLSPARRVFYISALIIFIVGILGLNTPYLVFSFLILNVLLAFELADKLIVKDDIVLAKKIQKRLMPEPPFYNEQFDISAFSEAAREVGGDYFDIVESDKDDKTYVIIGDISGKGIAAALYMVRVQTILQFLIENNSDPKKIIIELKKYFAKKLEREYFLTLSIASIDKNGKIKYSNAGHLPLIHYKQKENTFVEINPTGIGIGFNDKGLFEKTLAEEKVKTETNDILCFCTDGVTEAMNQSKVQFGMERLKIIIKENHDKPIDDIKNIIIQTITNFRGNAEVNDDISLVLMKAK
ncbi:MAG: serine/threonine-protein phosphatase [Bacteroidetes bacterium]|nr:serine/threonine-protein phosphatase [Bacteroidota bacterium]MBU1116452.1 serine/threonine-protein phosphatase [Bacteroidota bacterium]MBU1800032.1 serine/threonine-protein phosphatase [Bacteroidota bacterium]